MQPAKDAAPSKPGVVSVDTGNSGGPIHAAYRIAPASYLYSMNRLRLLAILLLLFLNVRAGNPLRTGIWRAELQINDTLFLPFTFLSSENGIDLMNGKERLPVNEISFVGDSVLFRFPVFDAEIRCLQLGDSLTGYFHNYMRKTKNRIPFRAAAGQGFRFSDRPEKPVAELGGRWQLIFDDETGENRFAVAEFEQDGPRLTGTIRTPTGDHRFLEGECSGKHVRLSAFDGSHAFLYTAELQADSSLRGHFFSGMHHHETWMAVRKADAELPDPDALAFLRPGYSTLDFNFPDHNGKRWTPRDPSFINKVLVVQLLGSWCPNCMDETAFLSDYYRMQRDRGVEIIGVAYERTTDSLRIWKNIDRFRNFHHVDYPLVYGGYASKDSAAKTLPMLNRVFAFPTTIIIDRKRQVRRVHSGFNGPATGQAYKKETAELSAFIDRLLAE